MKTFNSLRNNLIKGAFAALLLSIASPASAQVPIAYWDFEDNSARSTVANYQLGSEFHSTQAGSYPAISISGSGVSSLGTTGYTAVTGYSGTALRIEKTGNGRQSGNLNFTLNTTGYKGLTLSAYLMRQNSGTGTPVLTTFQLQYYNTSSNSWVDINTAVLPSNSTFELHSWTLPSNSFIENNSSVQLRFIADLGNASSADGFMDNLTIFANEVVGSNTFDNLAKIDAGYGFTTPIKYNNLKINGSAIEVNLGSNLYLKGVVDLTAGFIVPGTHTFVIDSLATISNAGANSYVKATEAGRVQRTVSAVPVLFPVGSGTYTPVTIQGALGGSLFANKFNVGVRDGVEFVDGTSLTADHVNRTWFINSASTASGVLLDFSWTTAAQLTGFNPAGAVEVAQRGSTNINDVWVGAPTGAVSGSSPFTVRATYLSSMPNGMYAITSNIAALPVEMISFTGKTLKGDVLLNWATASEINNDRFEVERSTDGYNYIKVGEVAGNGNSQERNDYNFTDFTAQGANLFYYRLRQVDFNGQAEYSNVVVVRMQTAPAPVVNINVFPNPTADRLNIAFNNHSQEATIISVMDITGRVVMQQVVNPRAANFTESLNINELPQGTYFVKVTSNSMQDTKTILKK